MPKLPDPSLINRKAPSPGGPAGYIRQTNFTAPGADTSIGDALQNIGDEAFRFAMVEKARMDDVAVDDAENQLVQSQIDLTAEYSKINSGNTVNDKFVPDHTTKFKNSAAKISSGLKNDSQKRKFDRIIGKRKLNFGAGLVKYQLGESDKFATETYNTKNSLHIQNGFNNYGDENTLNDSAGIITDGISKEAIRAGHSDGWVELEMMQHLGSLWGGAISEHIRVGSYTEAKKLLTNHKDVLGKNYGILMKSMETEKITEQSQKKAANILQTVNGDVAQRKAARDIGGTLGDQTLKRVKNVQTEIKLQKEADGKAQSENDIKWISDFGVEALGGNTLTIDEIESAGLSPENDALWKTKYFNQGEKKDKEKMAQDTNNTYANWLEKVTLEPNKYTPEDVAKDIDPNGGGLTGPQYTTVLSAMASGKGSKTTATSAAVRGKAQLKSKYNRGDFGTVETGKDKFDSDSWETYSNFLIDYQQKIIEEPNVDHTDWFNARIEEEWEKPLYEELEDDWTWGPFKDNSDKIITEHLLKKNIMATPEIINAVRKKYQTDKLGVVPETKSEKSLEDSTEQTNDPLGIR